MRLPRRPPGPRVSPPPPIPRRPRAPVVTDGEPDYTMSWDLGDDGTIRMTCTTSSAQTFERLRRTAVECGFEITREVAPDAEGG